MQNYAKFFSFRYNISVCSVAINLNYHGYVTMYCIQIVYLHKDGHPSKYWPHST